jgi:hypothetical protein
MPRAKPFTQNDLRNRAKLTGLDHGQDTVVVFAASNILSEEEVKTILELNNWCKREGLPPVRRLRVARRKDVQHSDLSSGITYQMRAAARGWHFDGALDVLGIKDSDEREWVRGELIGICVMHKLEVMVEKQETPGRMEATLKLARRLVKTLKNPPDKATASRARKRLRSLPVSIQMEAGHTEVVGPCLQGRQVEEDKNPLPPPWWEDSAIEWHSGTRVAREPGSLPARRSREVLPGPVKSWALRNTVRRLQALAGEVDPTQKWDGAGGRRRAPKRLIEFIARALCAVGIAFPSLRNRRREFLDLMVSPDARPPKLDQILERQAEERKAKLRVTIDEEPFSV